MTIEHIDPYDDAHCCECVVCGGHRAAYSSPPVCREPNCLGEWQIETSFVRAVSCPYCHAPDTGRETCEQCGRLLMTIESAESEYNRLLKTKKHTSEEVWEGWIKLCEAMDKLRMERNNICDNDEQEGDVYP